MNTSAYETVRYPARPNRFRTEADLVNQDNRLPRRGDIKSTLQGLVDLCGRNTQITGSNHVQRFANVFGCGLGGQRLSAARGPEEVDDETLALALNEVVESKILVVGLHKGLE